MPEHRRISHFRVLTEQPLVNTTEAREKASPRDRDHALAAAMLGDLVATAYQYGFEDSKSLLERAEALGRKAVALDPNCQPARFTMALVRFLKNEQALFLEEADQCLELNPNRALNSAALALHLYMAGEQERGTELMHKRATLVFTQKMN